MSVAGVSRERERVSLCLLFNCRCGEHSTLTAVDPYCVSESNEEANVSQRQSIHQGRSGNQPCRVVDSSIPLHQHAFREALLLEDTRTHRTYGRYRN